jgi:hypothetical protein
MRLRVTVCFAALALATGCAAPMFSDARMLQRGQVEVTPAVNPVYVSENEDTTHVANDFSVRALFGISNRLNVGAGYNRTQLTVGEEDFGFDTIAFGPKFGLVPDRVAVAVPVGFAFGEDIEVADTWQVHPTLFMTFPMNQRVDFNPAVRFVIPVTEDRNTLVALHAGFGVRTGRHLVLRPEAAVVFDPGEDGVVWTFGLGASFKR